MEFDSLSTPNLIAHVRGYPNPTLLELELAERLEEATREIELMYADIREQRRDSSV